jgi:hypothetical protein
MLLYLTLKNRGAASAVQPVFVVKTGAFDPIKLHTAFVIEPMSGPLVTM